MGYSAGGSGTAKVKEGVSDRTVNELLQRFKKTDLHYYYELERSYPYNDSNTEIDICFYDDHWNEDETYEVLNLLVPVIESGAVTCNGDEDCHWRYVFNGTEWEEKNGIMGYGEKLDDISDEDLIKAVELRGYSVKQPA